MYTRVIHILIYILAALRRHAEQDVQRSVRHVLRVADPYDARFVHLVTLSREYTRTGEPRWRHRGVLLASWIRLVYMMLCVAI